MDSSTSNNVYLSESAGGVRHEKSGISEKRSMKSGLSTRFGRAKSNVSLLSRETGVSAVTGFSDPSEAPSWQWEHHSGWKSFTQAESERIETFWQGGNWMLRMKSNAGSHQKPREIYFVDMLQFDPSSDSQWKLRRIPQASKSERIKVACSAFLRSFLIGEDRWWKPKSKADYDRIRFMSKETFLREHLSQHRVHSWWYRTTESWTFGGLTFFAILMNSIYIWLDADYNPGVSIQDTPIIFTIIDNMFTAWFTFEAVARVMAYKRWRFVLQDSWLVLDILLASMMVFETWLLPVGLWIAHSKGDAVNMNTFSILRGFRLLRLVRVARLFKVFPQLFVLMKGMALAMKSLFYTLVLMFVLLFLFGVAMKNFSDVNPALQEFGFETVTASAWRLMIDGILMDSVGDLLNDLLEVRFTYVGFILLFIFVGNVTMVNMLIGVLCDVISRVTEEQISATELEQLEDSLEELLEAYDTEDDKSLKQREFHRLMSNADFRVVLDRHGIDVTDLIRLETVFYEDRTEINFDAFLEKIFQLRGGNVATVNDMSELRAFLNRRFNTVAKRIPAAIGLPQVGSVASEELTLESAVSREDLPQEHISGQVAEAAVAECEARKRTASALEALERFKEGRAKAIEKLNVGHAELKGEVAALQESVDEILRLVMSSPDKVASLKNAARSRMSPIVMDSAATSDASHMTVS